jgi:hypothetical protein
MRAASAAAALLATALVALPLSACGSDGSGQSAATSTSPSRQAKGETAAQAEGKRERERREAESVAPSRCPEGVAECAEAEGRVVYVEKVDPDGDGDAHIVVLEWPGVSLPGLTAIDVRRGLRPDPLPRHGTLVSAAGPVQVGSHGQDQIHALLLHVAGE